MLSIIKNRFKRLFITFFVIATVFSVLSYRPSVSFAADSLEQQLLELQKQLEEIKKQQKELKAQISSEDSTQNYLKSQISTYDSSIRQTELLIEESSKQIELYTAQINLLSAQILNTQQQIEITSLQISDRYDHINEVTFSLYRSTQISSMDKLLQGSPVDESMYRKHFFDQSREQAQILIAELEDMKAEQESQKLELENSKLQSEELKVGLENEKLLLEAQRSGLSVQRQEKEAFLRASQGREAELTAQEKELRRIAASLEAEMEAIEIELLSRVQNGTQVSRAQTVAKIGRTGHVLTYGDNPRTPEVYYGWYYPHPTEQPIAGSHLHFKVYLNGSVVNPNNHFGTDKLADPLPGHIISQGYKSTHKALDMVYPGGASATYGKLIKASCSGTITYHTSYFDADDKGYAGGPFPRHDAHFYQLTCDKNTPQSGYVVFGWHIQ